MFLKLVDENGETTLVKMDRVLRVFIGESHITGTSATFLELEPLNRDDPGEILVSRTPVEDVWNQIRDRN